MVVICRVVVLVVIFVIFCEIEGCFKLICNIEKIIKMMKIVVLIKFNCVQCVMIELCSYGEISNKVYQLVEIKFFEGEGKKKFVVVCSFDKGFCGGVYFGFVCFIC